MLHIGTEKKVRFPILSINDPEKHLLTLCNHRFTRRSSSHASFPYFAKSFTQAFRLTFPWMMIFNPNMGQTAERQYPSAVERDQTGLPVSGRKLHCRTNKMITWSWTCAIWKWAAGEFLLPIYYIQLGLPGHQDLFHRNIQ